jgi:hypothetical protein
MIFSQIIHLEFEGSSSSWQTDIFSYQKDCFPDTPLLQCGIRSMSPKGDRYPAKKKIISLQLTQLRDEMTKYNEERSRHLLSNTYQHKWIISKQP